MKITKQELNEKIIVSETNTFTKAYTIDTNNTQKESTSQIREEKFRNMINIISSHFGIFTFLISMQFFFIRFLIYIFLCGKYDFLNISRIHINISSENVLYDLCFYTVVAIVFFCFNCIPYRIFSSEEKWSKKISNMSLILIIFTLIFFCILCINQSKIIGKALILDNIIQSFLMTILLFITGSVIGIQKIPIINKNNTNQNYYWHKLFTLKAISVYAIVIASYMLISYSCGHYDAGKQKVFKFIDNYVVLYENTSHFIVSNYEISRDNSLKIYKTTQKLINKEGVKTTLKEYKNVDFNPQDEKNTH